MINDIKSINIKGEFFENLVEWDFVSDKKDERLFLIYGNNGSGKTTFSKAVFEYKSSIDGTYKNFNEIYFKDKLNNVMTLNKNNIWSFNDEFIQKNIRIKNSGINAIVMFGEAGDIDSQIDVYNSKLKSKKEELKTIDLTKYDTPKDVSCIKDSYNIILNALKAEWSINDKRIKGGTRNSSVNDTIIDKVLRTPKTNDSLSILKSNFDQKLQLYNSLNKDATIITSTLTENIKCSKDNEIIVLLNKTLNKPVFGDLENKILEEINSHQNLTNITTTKEVINNLDICPICFQPIPQNHKHSVIDAINKVFDDEANKHIFELEQLVLDQIPTYDFSPFVKVIDAESQAKVNNLLNEINKTIALYKQEVDKKIKNVFLPILIENLHLDDKINELQKLLLKCNALIDEYNKNVRNIDNIKDELFIINEQMSYILIKPLYDNYQKLIKEKKQEEEKLKFLNNDIDEILKKIKELNAKKKNLNLGLKEINDDLLTIFHTRKKLQLILDEGMYYVQSNGRRIQFNNLSVGEKNVIGLCYFFSLIRNEHSKINVFNDEMFIVLDDPISSFDFSNKYGIYSYIKKMLSELFIRNDETKVVILTHELETLVNLDKIRADFNYKRKIFKIKDKQLIEYDVTSSNYKNMLIEVIDLIRNGIEITSESINTTRRILEAFCAFNYNMGLNEFSRDTSIFSTIPDNKIRDYLFTAVYRFVLNNESHTEDAIKGMPENAGYDSYNDDEKKQVIIDTLLLIYSFNKLHLQKILKDKGDKTNERFNTVESWYENLKTELSLS